jgi:hypothetical protein
MSARITGTRLTVASAAIAVIASFAAAPVASADTNGGTAPARATHPVMRHHPSGTAQHTRRHHAKPAVQRRTSKPIYKMQRPTRVTAPHVALARPQRAARPVTAVRRHVHLWSGTPSYTVSPHRSATPAVIPGISAACQKSGNKFGTWSPASCPNGYEITADVHVPVGKTLTINPNTIVYFDTTPVVGPLQPGVDPSSLPDLVVDGTLVVAGTAARPVTLTSANAAPSSSTDPVAGDWGYLFFNHTGANKGAGSMNNMRLLFGQGLAADHVAPKLTNSTITNVAAGTNTTTAPSIDANAGIDYVNIPGGSVTLSGVTFDGAETAGTRFISTYSDQRFTGTGNYAGHAFTLNIAHSQLTGGGADTVYAESETDGATAAANNAGVALNVHHNKFTQTKSSYELDVYSYTNPATVPGTSAVTGSLHDNVMTGGDASNGVYLYADVQDSKAAGAKNCLGDSACVIVPFSRNRISAYNTAVETYVDVEAGPGNARTSTPIGKVIPKTKKHKKRVIPGGTYQSEDNDAWESYSYNNGTGDGRISVPVVKAKVNSYDSGMYIAQDVQAGSALVNSSVTDSSWVSYDSVNLYVEKNHATNASKRAGSTGLAKTTVLLDNVNFSGYSYNFAADDTTSDRGPATSNVTAKDSRFVSDDYGLYAYAYAAYEAGKGAADNTLTVLRSDVTSYYSALWLYTDTEYGASAAASPATGTIKATSDRLTSYDEDTIYNEVYASQQTGSHGAATANTTVNKSDVNGYYAAVYNYAESGTGAATSSPRVVNSTLTSGDDDAIDNEVYSANDAGSGPATGNPVLSGSTANAYDYGIYNYVESDYGKGTATANPVISNSTVTSYSDDLVYNEAYGTDQAGSTGSAVANPLITGSKVTTDYNLVYNYAYGYYGSATANPAIRSSIGESGDDNGIENYAYGSQTSGTGFAHANPVISKSTVHTYDYGIENYGYSNGGSSVASPLISKSTVNAADDEVIYNYSKSSINTGTGSASGSPRIVASKVHTYYDLIENYVYGYRGNAGGSPVIIGSKAVADDDYGIYNYVYSDYQNVTTGHHAVGNPKIKTSTVNSYDGAIYNYVYGYAGAATANPVISSSTMAVLDDYAVYNEAYANYLTGTGAVATANGHITSSTVHAYDEALYQDVYSYQGAAVGNPVIKNSTLTANSDDAIENNVYGSSVGNVGSATGKPVITGSSIMAYDTGLYNYVYSYRGKAVANPTVSATRIKSLFDYGVDNEAYGSKTSGATGTATANAKLTGLQILIGDGSDGLYDYAWSGSGAATSNPLVSSTHIDSPDGYGVEAEAYSAQDAAGVGAATANPVLNKVNYAGYYNGLYTYAIAGNGNSLADGSFTIKASRLAATDDVAVDGEAYSAGTGTSRVNPAITGSKLRAPDDDVVDIYSKPAGTGASRVGGGVTSSSLIGYGDGFWVDATGSGAKATLFDTTFKNTLIRTPQGLGIDATYVNNGASNTMSPTITGGSIIASNDYAIDLEATGYGTVSTDTRTVAPTISGLTTTSYDGLYFYANDSSGSANPGTVRTGGSVTKSDVTSYDDYGIYSEAYCNYCGGGSSTSTKVSNTSINAYDAPIYFYSHGSVNAGASSSLGGSVTSTKGNVLYADDDYGIYAGATSGAHNASSTFSASGLHVAGYSGGIYHEVGAPAGSGTNSAYITNNVIDNGASSSSDGIYDSTTGTGGGGLAIRKGSISSNVVTDMPNGANGIDVVLSATTEQRPRLRIAFNRITNLGDYGISVVGSGPTLSSLFDVTISHNTITRTGATGIYTDAVKAIVSSNRITGAGKTYTGSPNQAGLFVNDTPFRGSVSCNVIWGNAFGIEYGSGNQAPSGGYNGDPATHKNTFQSLTSSVRNSHDIRTAGTGTTNAENNFWGGTPRKVATGGGTIDSSPALSNAPKCAKTAGA